MNDEQTPVVDRPSFDSPDFEKQEQRLQKSRMRFFEHLVELRKRLLISILAVLAGGIASWIFYDEILNFLVDPYCNSVDLNATGVTSTTDCLLLVTDPLEPLGVRFMVAIYSGVLGAMPILLYQLWRFVTPGLYKKERNYTLAFVMMGFLLFAGGVILAFYTVPRALDFLTTIGGDDLVNFFSPRNYLNFLLKMMLAFGIGFEFPILLVFLQIIGILNYKTLSRFRPYAVVGLVIFAAVITPSGDPITLIVLSVPLYIFYELSFIFGWILTRRRNRSKKIQEKINDR